MGDVVRMRRRVTVAVSEEVAEAMPQLLRKGFIEIARYSRGQPIYRLTEKGNAFAAELQKDSAR